MTEDDAQHLRRAFALAREARARGDGAFGVVLLAADGAGVFEARNTAPSTGGQVRGPPRARRSSEARMPNTTCETPPRWAAVAHMGQGSQEA